MPAARDVGRTRVVKVRSHVRRIADTKGASDLRRGTSRPTPRPIREIRDTKRDVGRPVRSPAYRQALRDTYDAQTPQRKAEIRRAVARSSHPAARVIREHVAQLGHEYRDTKGDLGFGGRAETYRRSPQYRRELLQVGALHDTGDVGRVIVQAARGTGEALYHHPGRVLSRTGRDLLYLPVAAVGGVGSLAAETVTGTVHGHPFAGVNRLASGIAKDFSRRYGPLWRNDPHAYRQFVERVGKEGALPELLDATVVGSAEGGVLGRGLSGLARGGRLGSGAKRIATERPALRVSGDLAVPQQVHPNFFKALGQSKHDALRAKRDRAGARKVVSEQQAIKGLAPGPGEVTPLSPKLAARRQRIDASKVRARHLNALRNEQARELSKGVEKDLHGLSRREQAAVFHVTQGLTHLTNPAEARRWLATRQRQIIAEREADALRHRLPDDLNTRPIIETVRTMRRGGADTAEIDAVLREHFGHNPELLAHVEQIRPTLAELHRDPHLLRDTRELKAIQVLHDHADELFRPGSKLAKIHERVRALEKRVAEEHPALRSSTADARRYRPQGELLDMPYPYETRRAEIQKAAESGAIQPAEAEQALKALDAARPEIDRAYAGAVRDAAKSQGLPEPAYFFHRPFPEQRFGVRTLAVRKAVKGPRESHLSLFRRGEADVSPTALVEGLAAGMKIKHQHRAVAEIFDRHTLRETRGQSPYRIRKWLVEHGHNLRDFEIVDMGRFADATEHLGEELGLGDVTQSLQATMIDAADPRVGRMYDHGYAAMPKAVANEITPSRGAFEKSARVASQVQGVQSSILLGYNPTWLPMQVSANLLQSAIPTHGAVIPELARQAIGSVQEHIGGSGSRASLWHSLPPEARKDLETRLNVGVYEGHAKGQHLGSMGGGFAQFGYDVFESRAGQWARKMNPAHATFRLDDIQNKAFRRAVFDSTVKREAYKSIAREASPMAALTQRLVNSLRVAPNETLVDAAKRVLENPATVERLGDHVDRVLGDYLRYTQRERKALKNVVIFYGFFRYALKTLFYTLPVHHPIAAAISAKLGQLQKEEVDDLLGGPGAPWAYGRVFFEGKGGKLNSIDMARINPVSNPLTEALTGGPSKLFGFLSPVMQAAADQLASKDLLFNRGWRTHGHAEEVRDADLPTRGRILASDLLGAAAPYRTEMAASSTATQGDDSLLFDQRPTVFKGKDSIAREQARRGVQPGATEAWERFAFPFLPKPDRTREQLAARRERTAKAGHGRRRRRASGVAPIGASGSTGGGGGGIVPIP